MASRGRKTPPPTIPRGKYAPQPKVRMCLGEDCYDEFLSEDGEHFCPKCRIKDREVRILRGPRRGQW